MPQPSDLVSHARIASPGIEPSGSAFHVALPAPLGA